VTEHEVEHGVAGLTWPLTPCLRLFLADRFSNQGRSLSIRGCWMPVKWISYLGPRMQPGLVMPVLGKATPREFWRVSFLQRPSWHATRTNRRSRRDSAP